MNEERPFSSIIDAIGAQTLAKVLELDESHVRTMKARDSIPPEYWGQILKLAPKHGLPRLSHDTLRRWRNMRFARVESRAT